MNKDIAEGKWKQMKGKIQQKWGKLTDDDLDRIEGNREEFAGVMQERYGQTKEEAEQEFDRFRDSDI
ncbi:CsbD family protein [Marinobacter sp. X15-166B]|uniref:CsbD family protein n=1 Tax=Marinobacter sp. X15-166B TaxID=1897620 RepID=UPI00085C4764|nr:CsbD family protein [Marinobacter sp. X15-166B]OEY67490.1 general stress protein CsbD [Marinobacter sp. X15-166B]